MIESMMTFLLKLFISMGAKLFASSCLFSNRYHFIIGQELEYIIWHIYIELQLRNLCDDAVFY